MERKFEFACWNEPTVAVALETAAVGLLSEGSLPGLSELERNVSKVGETIRLGLGNSLCGGDGMAKDGEFGGD